MLVLQASLRYAAPAHPEKSVSGDAEVQIGNMIFCR
jgi:hypothetical protein